MGRKKGSKKSKANADRTKLLDGLDSKISEDLKVVLQSLAQGKAVSNEAIDALDDGDSRLTQLLPILRDLKGGNVTADTIKAINSFDSFGEQLQPILLAIAGKV